MSALDYTLNWSNGTLKPPFTVLRTAVDVTTTSLDIPGKDSTNWGERHDENLLHLLESFASDVAPRAPTIGQQWYSSATQRLSIYINDLSWKQLAFRRIDSAVAPLDFITGDLWYDTTSDRLKYYDNVPAPLTIANSLDVSAAIASLTASLNAAVASLTASIATKQDTLISGTNIKTVNGINLLGADNIIIDAVPVGSIFYVPSTTPPARSLKANGALLTRASYPDLYAYAAASGNMSVDDASWQAGQFSPGNGTTTFRIPDLRGEFIRGWDDGRGVDPARAIGTAQGSQNLAHSHTASGTATGHSGGAVFWWQGTGAGMTTSTSGGSEARPRNVALLPCIKYMVYIPDDVVPFDFTPTISVNTFNFNLKSAAIAAGWDQIAPLNAVVTVAAGVVVGSTSTTTYAFDTGAGFTDGTTLSLIIEPGAYISGAGGAGGAGTLGAGGTGENGGPALRAQVPISITNNGTIQGGGGGGGGGGDGWGGGDGGAGAVPGAGGTSTGVKAPPEGGSGAAGTLTAAGVSSSYGGAGGAPGMAGSPSETIYPGVGGAGGACTSGFVNISWLSTGNLYGTLA